MNLTKEQLELILHALGLTRPGLKDNYRNYYCASRGDERLVGLAQAGAMRLYRQCESYDWYTVTDEAQALAWAEYAKRQPSRAKRRYLAWLSISDVRPGLTFREFLTSPEWAERRL